MLGRAWAATFGGPAVTPLLIKLPFMLADLGAAAFVFLLVRRLFGTRAAVIGTALFLFNPGVIFLSTVWGYNDAIPTMMVVACVWLLVTGRIEWAAVAAVLAFLVKFQYGFLIPIVAVVGLKRDLFGRSSDRDLDGQPDPRRIAVSLLAAILTLAIVCLPFGVVPFDPGNPSRSLFHQVLASARLFPGVTQNAFNLWMNPISDVVRVDSTGQTAGHVVDDLARVGIGNLTISLQSIGGLLFIGTVVLALLVLRRRDDGLSIVFVALVIAVAFFALPTRVHERYLYPAVALGIPLVFASGRAWRWVYVAVSAVLFLDVYWVYTFPVGNIGPGRGILAWTIFSPAGIYLLSFATVVSMAWLVLRSLDPVRLPWGRVLPSDAAENALAARMEEGARPAWLRGRSRAGGRGVARGVGEAVNRLRDAPARLLGRLLATEDWLRGRAPDSGRAIGAIAFLSLGAALIAAQVGVVPGKWLWNLDMPKLDFPLAQIFHDALASGRLPLWNDNLGLGFPLYAEGQIGAFYPPNWLIFRLPPLAALDLTRVVHLGLAGTGAGMLALRLTGSRAGSLVAALCAVLGGAIATKLEWHNLVAAYGWMPWVLVPLVRRPGPTRVGLVLAGVAWGIQALAGHPNTWLLTGLAAAVLMVATRPRRVTLARVLGFGLLGAAVGAVQLIPTAILTTLSVRSLALSASDLFASAATPFDILGFGFGNPFVQAGPDGAWNLATGWYPDGSFALLEAGAYVGLPMLVFAAVGFAARRARSLVVTILVMLAIPVVAAFKPEPWTVIPILNALRSPVRSYVVVALLLGVLAAMGIGRLARRGRAGANHAGRFGTAAHRAERVREELPRSHTVTEAIYGAGFNSSGRFYATSSQVLGMTPTSFRTGGHGASIRFAVGECSLGSILVAATDKGVCAILLGDDPDALVRDLQDRFPRAKLIGGDADFEHLVAKAVGLVEAPALGLDLPLHVRGTAFQQRVWQALREIPAGSTATYTEIAGRIGSPRSVRAVGQACASNAIAVAIPCHRVVRSDGSLSGYRWGLERKRALLDREAPPG